MVSLVDDAYEVLEGEVFNVRVVHRRCVRPGAVALVPVVLRHIDLYYDEHLQYRHMSMVRTGNLTLWKKMFCHVMFLASPFPPVQLLKRAP
jgi:hypothetical protein